MATDRERLTVYLPEHLIKTVQRIAGEKHFSVSSLVEMCIVAALGGSITIVSSGTLIDALEGKEGSKD